MLTNKVNSEGRAKFWGFMCGFGYGAFSGGFSQLTSNAIEQRLGRQNVDNKDYMNDSVLIAMLSSGVMGGFNGYLEGSESYQEKIKKQTQAKEQRQKEEELSDQLHQDIQQRRALEKKMHDEKEKNELLNKGKDQSKNEKSKNPEVEVETPNAELQAKMKELDALRYPGNQNKPWEGYFSSAKELDNLIKKLGIQDKNVTDDLIQILRDIDHKSIYCLSYDNTCKIWDIEDIITKQLGHISGFKGYGISSPTDILGHKDASDRTTALTYPAQNVIATNLEGNYSYNSLRYKLYGLCKALCKNIEVGIEKGLKEAIVQTLFGCQIEKSHSLSEDEKQNLANRIVNVIKNLSEGHQFTMPTGMLTHATCHTFERNHDEVTARIYNGGGGCKNHAVVPTNPGFVYPYSFKPIDIADPNFVQYIYKLLSIRNRPFASALFEMYCPQGLTADKVPYQDPIPKQLSGNCSWQNFTAGLSPKLRTPEQDFNPHIIMHELSAAEQIRLSHQGFPNDHYENCRLPKPPVNIVRFSREAPFLTSSAPKKELAPNFQLSHFLSVAAGSKDEDGDESMPQACSSNSSQNAQANQSGQPAQQGQPNNREAASFLPAYSNSASSYPSSSSSSSSTAAVAAAATSAPSRIYTTRATTRREWQERQSSQSNQKSFAHTRNS